jgi:putative membrane protein
MSTITPQKIKQFRRLIIVASIAIPLVIAILFGVKVKGYDFSFLPPIYATINGLTSLLLVAALVAIKKGNVYLHKTIIKVCISLSLLFLICYIAYHTTSESTSYGGEGIMRTIYFIILITHILLSTIIVPFILFTYLYGWSGDFVKHKRLAKITWPLWMYVTVSGVVVYWMIAPYYGG